MKNHSLVLLLFLFSLGTALAQRTITGTVTDEEGEPLIGASVLVKGTTTGTVTDFEGNYSLAVPEGSNTLVFSYTGFTAQEVPIGSSDVVDVSLREGLTLEEAVVTALGVTREEKSLGYSVQSVDGEDLTRARETNIINSLTGRIAGVQVTGGSGNIGGSSRITIRGVNSFTGENEPLFVVDGVPLDNSNFTDLEQERGSGGYDYGNAIQDINPDDIATINVLKGAAATALYGSRGANGVVMITTKSGDRKGKKGIGVSVNSNVTFNDIFVFPDYQSRYGGGAGPWSIRPRGYDDNSGFYKVPLEEYDEDGNLVTSYSSFDLVPDYATDESWGPAFDQTAGNYLEGFAQNTAFDNGQQRFLFPQGFGSEAGGPIMYRAWDSWDDSDPNNFGISRPWQASPNDVTSFYETGVTWTNNIALSGGDENSSFRLSYTNLNQKGVLPNSELERHVLNFNGRLKLADRLSAFVTGTYTNSDAIGRPGTGYDGDGLNVSQMFNQWFHRQLDFERLENYKNPDGSQRTWNRRSADDPNPNFWDNPYWTRFENFQNDERNRIFGNFGLRYDLTNWLSATARVTTDYYTDRREERIAVGSITQSRYRENLFEVNETNLDLLLEANKQLTEDWSISALAGGNLRYERRFINQQQTRDGLNVPLFYNLENSKGTPLLNDELFKKQVNGVFGSVSFGYQNFVYLDLKGRNDWSSTLPSDNNSYFYPAVAGSLIFSELLPSNDVISFGKVRVSWAQVGNDTDPYRLFKTFAPLDNIGSVPSFSIPNQLPNSELKPERTKELEAGLEMSFLRNRIGLDVSVYDRTTFDQIVPLGTSGATGYTSMIINAGEMKNQGVELALNLRPVEGEFTWDIGFNFARNINEVVELDENDPELKNLPIVNAPFQVSFNAFEGEPFGTILGTGILKDEDGNRLINPNTGYYLTTSQVVPLGNVMPDFTGGVINSFSWKGFSLNTLIDFQKGGDLFSLTNNWGKFSGLFEETAEGNIREDGIAAEGVLAELDSEGNPILVNEGDPNEAGDETYASTGQENDVMVPATSHYLFNGGFFIGEADTYDATFVKLREVSLGYTFPSRMLSNIGINNLTLRLVGRNLAIIHKNVPHIDPESAISASNIQGLEGGQNPSVRSIGLDLKFDF